jgi:hypothetical protein
VHFEADWQHVKERKQKLICQNNQRKNAKRSAHTHAAGDKVVVENKIHTANKVKTGAKDRSLSPMSMTSNGAVRLQKRTPAGGVVFQTWNIQKAFPHKV